MMTNRIQHVSKTLIMAIVAVSVALNSCTYFTEPEPITNGNVRVPTAQNTVLSNYGVDQVVIGTITPTLVTPVSPSSIDSIGVMLDSTWIGRFTQPPYTFTFNTASWPDGRHQFQFTVYTKPTLHDSLGMLHVLGVPSYIYRTTLIFDNASPTAPQHVTVVPSGRYLRISWDSTSVSNFVSYTVRRDGNLLATIPRQGTSFFVDSTLPDFYRTYYEVGVTKGEMSAFSDRVSYSKGTSLGFPGIQRCQTMPNDQLILYQWDRYAVEPNGGPANNLLFVSTQTLGLLNTLRMSDYDGVGILATNLSEDTLVFWNQGNGYGTSYAFEMKAFTRVDIWNWDVRIGSSSYSGTNAIAVRSVKRVYASCSCNCLGAGSSGLCVFKDSRAGDINRYGSIVAYLDGFGRFLSLSPDGLSLLAVDDRGIKKYSVANDTVVFSLQSSNTDRLGLFWADWKNSNVYVTRQNTIVESWDALSLNRTGSFELPASKPAASGITAVSVSARNLYVAYTIGLSGANGTLLAEYDKNTRQLLRSWTFQTVVWSVGGSENGRYLLALAGADQWIIDLGASAQ